MVEARPILKVPILLDRQRNMLIDWNAMYLIEEKITIRRGGAWISMQALGDISKLSIADMRTVIWGSLVHEDEALTEKDVGKMIHGGNQEYVSEKLAEAFNTDSPAEGEAQSKNPTNGTDPLAGATG